MIALLFILLCTLYIAYQYKIYKRHFGNNYKSMALAIIIELPEHMLFIGGILIITILLNIIL